MGGHILLQQVMLVHRPALLKKGMTAFPPFDFLHVIKGPHCVFRAGEQMFSGFMPCWLPLASYGYSKHLSGSRQPPRLTIVRLCAPAIRSIEVMHLCPGLKVSSISYFFVSIHEVKGQFDCHYVQNEWRAWTNCNGTLNWTFCDHVQFLLSKQNSNCS